MQTVPRKLTLYLSGLNFIVRALNIFNGKIKLPPSVFPPVFAVNQSHSFESNFIFLRFLFFCGLSLLSLIL